jgi:hypothetical protein
VNLPLVVQAQSLETAESDVSGGAAPIALHPEARGDLDLGSAHLSVDPRLQLGNDGGQRNGRGRWAGSNLFRPDGALSALGAAIFQAGEPDQVGVLTDAGDSEGEESPLSAIAGDPVSPSLGEIGSFIGLGSGIGAGPTGAGSTAAGGTGSTAGGGTGSTAGGGPGPVGGGSAPGAVTGLTLPPASPGGGTPTGPTPGGGTGGSSGNGGGTNLPGPPTNPITDPGQGGGTGGGSIGDPGGGVIQPGGPGNGTGGGVVDPSWPTTPGGSGTSPINPPGGNSPASPPETSGAVPEPASWATMLFGFGLIGSALRARRARWWPAEAQPAPASLYSMMVEALAEARLRR